MDERASFLLQNKIIINVFEYLPLDDIKACRLVCRNWYHFCNVASITEREIFVFHRSLHMPNEINVFLNKCNRHRFNIVFHAEPLHGLHWHRFGANVICLRLINCPHLNELKIWTILLTYTPNLKYFEFAIFSYFFNAGIFELLKKDGVENSNVKQFIFYAKYLNVKEPTSFIQTLHQIFPSVNTIQLPSHVHIKLQSEPPISSSITGLSTCFIDLREPLGSSLSTIENLKELDLVLVTTVDDYEQHFRQFFSRQIHRMQKLHLYIHLLFEENNSLFKVFSPAVDKKLLLYTLNSFINLKELRFMHLHCASTCSCSTLFFKCSEFKDFIRLTSRMTELQVLPFCIDHDNTDKVAPSCAASKTPMKMKVLTVSCFNFTTEFYFAEIFARSDLRFVDLVIKDEQLLKLKTGEDSIILSTVFRLQKNLKTLRIYIKESDGVTSGRGESTEKLIIRHEKLEILNLVNEASEHTMFYFLFASEFPNLSTLILHCEYCPAQKKKSFCEYLASRVSFSQFHCWLKKMPLLKNIHFPMFFHSDFDFYYELFKDMKRLKVIELMSDDYGNYKQICELFTNLPALKYVLIRSNYDSYPSQKDVRYHYCRSRKRLYRNDVLF